MATTSETRVEGEIKTILSSPAPDVVSATEKAESCDKKETWPSPVVVNKDQPTNSKVQPKRKRNFSFNVLTA